jgi:low affinity Fe/Cu permease
VKFDFRKGAGRRRFPASGRGKIARTREYYYSLFATLVVKIILFVFLWMLFVSSVKIMRRSFRNISDTWRIILPSAIAIIAFIVGYHIYKNIRDIRRYGRELEDAGNKIRRT